ncbi:MAG: hypothetical protein ACYDG5_04345 [Dehalococcoidales bacterium]
MHFHIDAVYDIAGFSTTNVEKGNYCWLLTKTTIYSDQPEFYKYVEQLSSPLFNKVGVFLDAVYQFLIIIHTDLSAELYINEFSVAIKIMLKRDVKKGEILKNVDIADIQRLSFANIEIKVTDRVIYCFKVGWKFVLYFNLNREINLDSLELELGKSYRYLSFQYVYELLENETIFEEMKRDGWFPFIDIVGNEYKQISEVYKNKFHFDDTIDKIIGYFNNERIENITKKWWKSPIFNEKKDILQAGINAFLQKNKDGFINCINTLLPQVEGIVRVQYFSETGKGNHVPLAELLNHLYSKGSIKAGSDSSLLLQLPFLKYLKDVVYSDFNIESGKISLSRHTTSHGVAAVEAYTKAKALQAILVLDQIYFYID